jgi:carbon-monoxide dehydrogenase medium subunit
MQDFEYTAAQSTADVLSWLVGPLQPVRILCGGTDLLVQLRENMRSAALVLDIKAVPELNGLTADAAGLQVGAAVTCLRLCTDPAVRAQYPGLVDAAGLIGSAQVQGRASLGGNLCNASPAADSIPALIVYGAVCQVLGPGGVRQLSVEDFVVAPGQTALQPGEFLTGLRVPLPPPGFGAAYLRFTPRSEMDIAVVGCAAALNLDSSGGTIQSCRLALGAVAPRPFLARAVGEYLAGKSPTPEHFAEAARLAQLAARPITDMRGTADQRLHLVGVLTRRALDAALARARASLNAIKVRS